ncbi:MAG: hypothetical protein NVSMB9_06450 [Isosphaeraceae bacterium]
MKRFIKRVLKAIWRSTSRVRRPIVQKIEEFLRRCSVQPAIHVTPPHVHLVCGVTEETGVLMDHLIRELVRLQARIDLLQQAVEDLTPYTKSGLVVVRALEGEEDEVERSAAG